MGAPPTPAHPVPPSDPAFRFTDAAAPLDAPTLALLVFLGAVWGGSFLFMRIAAPEIGALALVEVRLAAGALVLLPFLWAARDRFRGAPWGLIAGLGIVNSAVPFVLFGWAAERAPAGVGAITNSLSVPFTALVAYLFFGERIGTLRALALVGGLAGVAVLASGRLEGASFGAAALAGTVAALLYGVGANLVRRRMAGLPPEAFAAATLGLGALSLLPFAVARWPSGPVAPGAWAAAVALGVFCTGMATALYFRVLQRVSATRASIVSYLIPLFGVGWAWLLLGETPTPAMALAGLLILSSVALTQRA
jgi:drug/metabolite transporter (DMT)-like permease